MTFEFEIRLNTSVNQPPLQHAAITIQVEASKIDEAISKANEVLKEIRKNGTEHSTFSGTYMLGTRLTVSRIMLTEVYDKEGEPLGDWSDL